MENNTNSTPMKFDSLRNDQLMDLARQPEKLEAEDKIRLAKELRSRGLWMPQYLQELCPPNQLKEDPDQDGLLVSAWKGNAPLWKVWWLIGIPLNILMNIIEKLFDKAVALHGNSIILTVTFVLFVLALFIVWVRMAWLCAPNVKNKIWTPIAKVVIVVGSIGSFSMGLIEG